MEMSTEPVLRGTVVLITGGSRGLGRAMALGLALQGARLALVARPSSEIPMKETLDTIATASPKCECLALYGDVTSEEDCSRFVRQTEAHFGKVDVLINNAGLGMPEVGPMVAGGRRFDQIDPKMWRRMMDVNVNGTWLMTRAVLPAFLRSGWGRIVNLSTSYSTMGRAGFAPYGPSKAAVEMMTVTCARELVGTGVTANLLLPGGPADTAMVATQDRPDRENLIRPETMAPPAVWLCSKASDGFTGMRVIAKAWDSNLPSAEAAQAASGPAQLED